MHLIDHLISSDSVVLVHLNVDLDLSFNPFFKTCFFFYKKHALLVNENYRGNKEKQSDSRRLIIVVLMMKTVGLLD